MATNIRYPAIPQPRPGDTDSLFATTDALKRTVEMLLGLQAPAGAKALTTLDLPAAVTALGGLPAGPAGAQGLMGPPGFGLDGEDAPTIIIPGPPGVIGPPGLIIPGRDGDDGLDALNIPGPPGVQGIPGPFVPGRDGEDGDSPMVPGPRGPSMAADGYFMVYRSGTNQTFTASAAAAKVQLQTETADDNGWYDNATNFRYTPLIAGTYYFYFNLYVQGGPAAGYPVIAEIFKNGAVVASGGLYLVAAAAGVQQAISPASITLDMNGSSDYVEFFVYSDMTAPFVIFGPALTYAFGFRIK